MAKQKNFHEKIVRKVRRDAGFAWTGSFVEDMRALVEGPTARQMRSDHPVIGEGFIATLQQEAIIRASDEGFRRATGKGLDDPLIYPGLMASWEAAPTTVEFAPGVLDAAPDAAGGEGTPEAPAAAAMPGGSEEGKPPCEAAVPGPSPVDDRGSDEAMRLRDLLAAQESKSASLEYHLKQARGAADDARREASGAAARAAVLETMDLPQTPAESLALAERAFPDRLAFLPSARKSAEDFRRGNAAEVWAVLRSVAMVLHPLVFGRGGGNIMREFQDAAGFEVTLREMKMIKRTGDFSRLRTVEYNGAEHDASVHVKGHSNRKGEALRVHFFADYDEPGGRIVITHCGEHLDTYVTPSL